MRRRTCFFLFLIISLTILLPKNTVGAVKTAQSSQETLKFGVIGTAGNWDPAIYQSSSINFYVPHCLESLVGVDDNGNIVPVLATNWTIHPRPDEGGHRNGEASITFVLREGVKFHDGSDWNATVARWNLDRNWRLAANFYGNTPVGGWMDGSWFDVTEFANNFTANWNLTWALNDPWISINPATADKAPLINRTEILENLPSGGKIKVYFNGWNDVMLGRLSGAALSANMISMKAYKADVPIEGYEAPSYYSGSELILKDMIGTGPYIFQGHTETGSPAGGKLILNENWWNYSNYQPSVEEVHIIDYADISLRDTALLAGDIDFVMDTPQMPLDVSAVLSNPTLKYQDRPLEDDIIGVTMLHTNAFGGGISRPIRKALSYAFEYDSFLTTVWNDRAVRAGGILSTLCSYYNASIPQAYYNLTMARQTLVDAGLAAGKNLGMSNSTAEWQAVADSDPIVSVSIVYNVGDETFGILQSALRNIGCEAVGTSTPSLWLNYVSTGAIIVHDVFPFIWPNNWWDPYPFLRAYFDTGSAYHLVAGSGLDDPILDEYLTHIYFGNETIKQEYYNLFADRIQNYHYPWLFIGQYKAGWAAGVEWDVTYHNFFPYYAGFRFSGEVPSYPPIQGYSIFALLSLSFIAITIVALKMRKKKL